MCIRDRTHTAIKQPNLIKIALYQPDIPQNTAAIIRICACFNTRLDIIEPCGFIMNDKRFKRIAMDYINSCKIKTFNNFEDFTDSNNNGEYDFGEDFEDWNSDGQWTGPDSIEVCEGCDVWVPNIDEGIDSFDDKYWDGIDNDGNGLIDDSNELASTETGYDDGPSWAYNIEQREVLLQFGRVPEYTNYYDSTKNQWFIEGYDNLSSQTDLCMKGVVLQNEDMCLDVHLKGSIKYNEDLRLYEFDVFNYDFGLDGLPGDKFDISNDRQGDGEFQLGEPLLGGLNFCSEALGCDIGLDGIFPCNN